MIDKSFVPRFSIPNNRLNLTEPLCKCNQYIHMGSCGEGAVTISCACRGLWVVGLHWSCVKPKIIFECERGKE